MSLTQCLSLIAGATLAGTAVADSAITADETRAIVAEMLADAETRSSLQSSGGTAGHDGKFFMSSAGGSFRLNVGGQIQFRYMLNSGDNLPGATPPDENDLESGFQTRRTKLMFNGTAHDNIDFSVVGAFDRGDGAFELEDVWTRFNINDNSSVRVGQFKLPFLYEELVSSSRQLTVDRSATNEFFNQGRSQGVEYRYNQDDWRLAVAFSDGFNTANTDYNNASEGDYAFTGRFEYKGAGNWNQFRDFTSAAGDETAWMLGAAGHYQAGQADGFGGDNKFYGYTIDANIKGDGWSAFGAFMSATNDPDGGTKLTDFGHVLQGAFRIPESKWEIFGRWDAIYADSDRANDDDFNTVTVGANYYMHGHAAKFTFDFQWFLDNVAGADVATAPQTGIGLLGDGTEDDEFGIRAQFQLLF